MAGYCTCAAPVLKTDLQPPKQQAFNCCARPPLSCNPQPQVLEILDDRVVRRLSEVQQENLAPAQQAQQQAGEQLKAREQAAAAAAAVVAGLQAAEAARPAAVLQSSSS